MSALYPDLDPPPGWTLSQVGNQVHLSAPDSGAPGTIVVSPLIGTTDRIPPPAHLLEQTLAVEAKVRLEVTARSGPVAVTATSGLEGASLECTGYFRPDQPVQRRIYVMYRDARAYYGVSFFAPPAGYDEHAETFWRVARSIRPLPPAP